MSLDKEVPVQLHYQLTNELRNCIEKGHWSIDDIFLTDREIMEKYNVSGTTVRRAVKQLVKEGWLERKPGKGTFIRKEQLNESLGRLTGFFEEIRAKGFIPSAEIFSSKLVSVNSKLLNQFPALEAFQENELVMFEKLHKCNDKPLVYVESFWRAKYGQKMLEDDLALEGLYEMAAKKLNLNLTKADQTISAGAASEKVAHILQIKKKDPVLIMERFAYVENELVEFSYNIYRSDRYRYQVVLHNDRPNGEMIIVP
ncbi:GntR family transcriptional regulator [Sporomusa acidovorans]|uniref:HTH-type transcriptional repressor NagR n=1 Tax=Sporomusa acidovorans (strain ATCC 49682 / DSM 3132 / Mol) TaxID=1123286 RepID=A0ABZ3J8C9_SPOA4|nr:GntR family transcriptional regulator [Sporomusa acidovorans]OZC21267.1 HTH-type transcriptional repressor YvoA [Sporomusa acidovorans DSM 3132]SDE66473.1 transcriptional regulator, GntR family [Sporomusa acidovorans]